MPSPCIEFGAQSGAGSSLIFEERQIAWGSDIDPTYVAELEARKHFRRTALVDVVQIPFADCEFGSVLFMNCIYHVDRDAALREIWRVLKPGGILVAVDAPGYGKIHPINLLLLQLGLRDWAQSYLSWTYKVHSIVSLKESAWWRSIGDSLGFEVIEVKSFASLSLARTTRILYEIAHVVRMMWGNAAVLRVGRLTRRARPLVNSLQKAVWEPLLLADHDLVKTQGALMSLVILRKPGPEVAVHPEDEIPSPVCPTCRTHLSEQVQSFRCPAGHVYPLIGKTPVLFPGWETIPDIQRMLPV